MKVRIDVTQDDIDEARRVLTQGSTPASRCCPVAQALDRLVHGPEWHVGGLGIVVADPGDGRREVLIDLPERAQAFIDGFDANRVVNGRPFSFDLDVPDDLVRQP